MTDKKYRGSRRKLLKSIAAGSGAIVAGKSLPESWSRPIVDSVMLPAHARTSDPTIYYSGTVQRGASIESDGNSLLAMLGNSLLPNVEASDHDGGYGKGNGWYICAIVSGGIADLTMGGLHYISSGDCAGIFRRGNIPLDGTIGTITGKAEDASNCGDWGGDALTATVGINPVNTSETNLAVEIHTKSGGKFELNVPLSPGGCQPEPPICDCSDL